MRRIILAVALTVAGCGGAKFATEAEELSYLSALSNPTPDQWKRRQELESKADAAKAAEAKKRGDQYAEHKAILDRQVFEHEKELAAEGRRHAERRAAEKKAEDAADIAKMLARADAYEKEDEFGLAFRCYKELAEKYPDADEAPMAREKASNAHFKAYGKEFEFP